MNDSAVLDAMLRYGGGFVRAFAAAARAAGPEILQRLKTAFPDIWERYEVFASRGDAPAETPPPP